MVAPSWCCRRWHFSAGFAGPSRHRAGIWVRYAGVFGPASRQRANLRALLPARDDAPSGSTVPRGSRRRGRVPGAELLCRLFAADALACPCRGRRCVVAVVVDSTIARTVLATLGLPCTPATFAPTRAPPLSRISISPLADRASDARVRRSGACLASALLAVNQPVNRAGPTAPVVNSQVV
jgi:hypothetical protein